MNWRFALNQLVQYFIGANGQQWKGIVIAHELFRDAQGTGEYAYVRWIDVDGSPAGGAVRIHVSELEEVPE